MRWRRHQIELSSDEIERLLPLVREVKPYFEQDDDSDPPTEFIEALEQTLEGIASSHGFANWGTGWDSDGTTVNVWVNLPDLSTS